MMLCHPNMLSFQMIHLSFFLALCMMIPVAESADQITCHSPDVPDGVECLLTFQNASDQIQNGYKQGTCHDATEKYLPGSKITYICQEQSTLMGNAERNCTTTGEWTGNTPFCDKPAIITRAIRSRLGQDTITDGDESTCVWWEMGAGVLVIPLNGNPLVRKIQIDYVLYSDNSYFLDIFITETENCGMIYVSRSQSRWTGECNNNQTAEFVLLRSRGDSFLKVCEAEILNEEGNPVNITSAPYTIFKYDILRNWTDGDVSTCDYLGSGIKGLMFTLNEKASIRAIRIYIDEIGIGDVTIELYITQQMKCGQIQIRKDSKQWHLLECNDKDTLAEFVKFWQQSSRFGYYLRLCEVQIFLRDGCDDAPSFQGTHGHLQMNRQNGALFCDTGFKPNVENISCRNNVWESSNALDPKCIAENEKVKINTNPTIIFSISVAAVLFIIFISVGLAIYLIRKQRKRRINEHVYDEINYDELYIPMKGAFSIKTAEKSPRSSIDQSNEYVL